MFIYRCLTSCFKSISVNLIYVAQWDKQDWVVSLLIYTERSYANRIHQVSMDRINVFGKRQNHESFMRSVHVLFSFLYIKLTDWSNSLSCVVILYKQHCVGFEILT